MEIFVVVKSFSYYHESSSIYLSCQVKEKHIFAAQTHPHYSKFLAVGKNEVINLKKTLHGQKGLQSILQILVEDLLTFSVTDWEKPQNCRTSGNPKFIFDKIRVCGILEESSFRNTGFTTQLQLSSAAPAEPVKPALPSN